MLTVSAVGCLAQTVFDASKPLYADQFQPYFGQTSGACETCNHSAIPRYTSDPGDDYCAVPWVDTTCNNGA